MMKKTVFVKFAEKFEEEEKLSMKSSLSLALLTSPLEGGVKSAQIRVCNKNITEILQIYCINIVEINTERKPCDKVFRTSDILRKYLV